MIAPVTGAERTRRRRHHRPGAARELPAVPGANARHGRTYFLATLLLPPRSGPTSTRCTASPATSTTSSTSDRRHRAVRATGATTSSPTSTGAPPATRSPRRPRHRRALADPAQLLRRLPRRRCAWTSPSPATRPTTTSSAYMWGSAAVIGLQMLPILGRADDRRGWDVLEIARDRSRLRLPADELPARCRRGPAPRTRLPAAGDRSTSSVSTATGCARGGSTNRSATCWPGRSSGPAVCTAGRRRASISSTRPRATACARR